ncbi:MAG: hypothetical protein ABSC87_00340 [Halobacteriota archaeon]
MNIEFSSILLFILGLLYLIMLPGYLILAGLKMHDLDIIETLTASFGIGAGVLTAISIALSLAGSLGLTISSLALANAAVLIVLCCAFYLRQKRDKRQNDALTH